MSEQTSVRLTVPVSKENRATGLAIIMQDPELARAYVAELASAKTSKQTFRYVTFNPSLADSGAERIKVLSAPRVTKRRGLGRAMRKLLESPQTTTESASENRMGGTDAKATVEQGARRDYSNEMNDMTREEFNARMETIETKMDGRVAAVSAKIDGFLAEQSGRDKAQAERDRLYDERFEATSRRLEDRDKVIDSKLDAMNATISTVNETVSGFAQHLDEKVREVKSSNRNTLLGILAIGVATVIGLWGANSTIVGSASSIFDSGARQAAQQQESQELLRETKELLRQIQLQAAPPTAPAPASQR